MECYIEDSSEFFKLNIQEIETSQEKLFCNSRSQDFSHTLTPWALPFSYQEGRKEGRKEGSITLQVEQFHTVLRTQEQLKNLGASIFIGVCPG